MKRIFIMLTASAFLLSACGDSSSVSTRNTNQNQVSNVMQNEMDKANGNIQTDSSPSNTASENASSGSGSYTGTVDIDISVMGSDMVYATVNQLMIDPNSYIGKTIKVEGMYYSSLYKETGKTYHFLLIQDAQACCKQGLEFVLADESGYPEENQNATIVGTFETYEEDGATYCNLINAVID